jgi:hypothetical protein
MEFDTAHLSHADLSYDALRVSNHKPVETTVTVDSGTFTVMVYADGEACVTHIEDWPFEPDGDETTEEAREIAIQDAKRLYADHIQKEADDQADFEFPSDYLTWDI